MHDTLVSVDDHSRCSTGSSDGLDHECRVCDGSGVETMIRRIGPMIQQMQGRCSSCRGEGRTIDRDKLCKKCHGQKVMETRKKLEITVAHGSANGEVIRFIGEGNQIVSVREVRLLFSQHRCVSSSVAEGRTGFCLYCSRTITSPNFRSKG